MISYDNCRGSRARVRHRAAATAKKILAFIFTCLMPYSAPLRLRGYNPLPKKTICILSILLLLSFATHKNPQGQNHSYYLTNSGNDQNDGSKKHPWKTIEKLNSIQLKAGDSIFFRSNEIFDGTIAISRGETGEKTKPIVISSFGYGNAIIRSKDSMGIYVYRSHHIIIKNLSLVGSGRKDGNTKDGLAVMNCTDISLSNLDIKGYQKAGLLIYVSSRVNAQHIDAHENGFAGISVTGDYRKRNCDHINIRYCTAENNPGDPTNKDNHSGNGIIAGNCKNILVEYCAATNNGWDMPRKGNGPVGIWCYEADSVVIQHCISYRNKTSPGAADGGGYDLDGGVTHSIIQYCLSYENQGSAFGIFQYAGASHWHDNTIRYNISENDGNVSAAHAGVFIWNSSHDSAQFKNCFFYNNVVYNEKSAAISYDSESDHTGFYFYNNIFVAKDSLIRGKLSNDVFLYNDWWSINGGFNMHGIRDLETWAMSDNLERKNSKVIGLNIDPGFKNAGHTKITVPVELNNFYNYRIPANSPLRIKGVDLKTFFGIKTGGKDFNGHNAPANGIGACFE